MPTPRKSSRSPVNGLTGRSIAREPSESNGSVRDRGGNLGTFPRAAPPSCSLGFLRRFLSRVTRARTRAPYASPFANRMREERCVPRVRDRVDGRKRPVPGVHLQGRRGHRVQAALLHALLETDSTSGRPVLSCLRG